MLNSKTVLPQHNPRARPQYHEYSSTMQYHESSVQPYCLRAVRVNPGSLLPDTPVGLLEDEVVLETVASSP